MIPTDRPLQVGERVHLGLDRHEGVERLRHDHARRRRPPAASSAAAKKTSCSYETREVASTRGDQLERRGRVGGRMDRHVEPGLARRGLRRARSRSRRDRGSASSRASASRAASPPRAAGATQSCEHEDERTAAPYACDGLPTSRARAGARAARRAPYSARASAREDHDGREDARRVERRLRLQHDEAEPADDPAHSPKTAPTAA